MDSSSHDIKDVARKVNTIKESPKGWGRLAWLGPSFLWMLSAAGSGEVLFTPRIAALYGYTLVWALLATVILKWFINREVGRYTVCTGNNIIIGFHTLPGTRNWAIWIILLPQMLVAVSTIAGMSGAAANALTLITGGSGSHVTLGLITLTGVIVLFGKYKIVELVASIFGVLLSIAVMVAAINIFPNGKEILHGLIPSVPPDVEYGEVLPWLGFMLAGAAGMMWYSNWVQARGYGAASPENDKSVQNISLLTDTDKNNLIRWIRQMTISNTLAVAGALLIAFAFLILGAQLLRPEGLIPKEDQMSEVLGQLLGNIWGPAGFWFMVTAIFITFWTTTLTNQDGWSRMFASGTKLLFKQFHIRNKWTEEIMLQRIYLIVLLIVLPSILYILIGKPVGLLKLAGIIEAAHIPIVAFMTLYLNKKKLPKLFQPSPVSFWGSMVAGVFFIVFAGFYLLQISGVINV